MELANLKMIEFPNTVANGEATLYSDKNGYSFGEHTENGEMALINWIDVYNDNKLVASIKQSVCNLFYN
jgi:hypothetical protein